MVGKKLVSVFSLVGLVSLMLFGCSSQNDELTQIGILQLVEHDALDSSREGFIKALEDSGYVDGENVSLTVQNAQGDIPTTQTIAKQFVSQNVDMIFAIATPAAQSAYNATKDIPILITAVTDPVEAGIVKEWEPTQTNVCGTSDMTPVAKQFELLKT
ncbi:MAG TPA: ABC transporter substrate-binding protein, partial [Firmicutes bacterium]|nr:ABC transporter substrate-binding protein [Bacillota bacterium]